VLTSPGAPVTAQGTAHDAEARAGNEDYHEG